MQTKRDYHEWLATQGTTWQERARAVDPSVVALHYPSALRLPRTGRLADWVRNPDAFRTWDELRERTLGRVKLCIDVAAHDVLRAERDLERAKARLANFQAELPKRAAEWE